MGIHPRWIASPRLGNHHIATFSGSCIDTAGHGRALRNDSVSATENVCAVLSAIHSLRYYYVVLYDYSISIVYYHLLSHDYNTGGIYLPPISTDNTSSNPCATERSVAHTCSIIFLPPITFIPSILKALTPRTVAVRPMIPWILVGCLFTAIRVLQTG